MRIMHVTKKYPHALGGDAVVVSQLRKHQRTAGHDVSIVTSNCDEIANDEHVHKIGLADKSANLDRITLRRILSLVLLLFKMRRILEEERPDVIHTHSVDMAFCVSFAARRYGIPLVHTFHIVTFYDSQQLIIRRLCEIWLVRNAAPRSITAPNRYDVGRLRAAGLTQTMLLPNGVDESLWVTDPLVSERFTFLTFGRLEAQKGYEYLIKAAAKLRQVQPIPFEVIIAGEGSQRPALEALIDRLHLEGTVVLAGRKTQEEIRVLLGLSDVTVFSSLYETTPITLLEAWAAGVPAIATSVGILRDVPKDFNAAYVVPPKNEQRLMLAMHSCMRDEDERSVIAAQGRAEVKKYTWSLIAESAEIIYKDALHT